MKSRWKLVLWILIVLVILTELIRDVFFMTGDYIGYVQVGNLTMNGDYIYANPKINTWPPFFSIASVPIAIIDNLNGYLGRFVWLGGSLVALVATFRMITSMSTGRSLQFFPWKTNSYVDDKTIHVQHGLILATVVILLKYIMDNMSNIQINILMMFMAVASIWYFVKGKEKLGAFILALSICFKVYTIFLLIYFILKREFKFTLWTIGFSAIFCAVPFFVYGWDQTLHYYQFWYTQNVVPFASAHHGNQSFFSMMRCYLSHVNPGYHEGGHNFEIYVNFIDLSVDQVKKVSYGVLAIAGLFVAYIFRKKLSNRNGLKSFTEYALVLSCIPLLSPLAWKAYFIFLLPAYFLNVLHLFYLKDLYTNAKRSVLMVGFALSILLVVGTGDLFVGPYLSDILEAYSVVTIGAILINLNLVVMYLATPEGLVPGFNQGNARETITKKQ